jgi:hypothetical protein
MIKDSNEQPRARLGRCVLCGRRAPGSAPSLQFLKSRARVHRCSGPRKNAVIDDESPGGVGSVKCERAFAPPEPLVPQSGTLNLQGGGSPTLGLWVLIIPLEKPVGGLPGLGLFPTARESGFEQVAPGICVPSWMAKAGVAGTANAAATITPAISFLITSPPVKWNR